MSTTNLPPLPPMPDFSAWSDACGMSHARDGFSPQELGEYATSYGATCAAAARAQVIEELRTSTDNLAPDTVWSLAYASGMRKEQWLTLPPKFCALWTNGDGIQKFAAAVTAAARAQALEYAAMRIKSLEWSNTDELAAELRQLGEKP